MTQLRSGSATDVGRVRTANQDLALETGTLFAVADGMGGHAGGEVAARVAIDALRAAFSRQPTVDGLVEAVRVANAAVWQQGQLHGHLRGMGTTVTAAALVSGGGRGDVMALVNVGDSRAYLFSGGRITQVTADHSLAEEKVRHGEMSEAEAAVHPHRHILTRALGVAADVDVDLWELQVRTGDRLLLCSDGLTNEVSPAEIAGVLAATEDPTVASRELVRSANEHGGSDNVTVVVVDVLVGTGADGDGAPAAQAAVASAVGVARSAPGPAPASPSVPTGPSRALDATGVQPVVTRSPTGVPDGAVPGHPLATAPAGGERPPKESRREARRRLGVPRRITFRVVGFVLLVAAVVVAAYFIVRWYAVDNWYVTTSGRQLVVYQGRPGGVLWFDPVIVDRTGVTVDQVLAIHLPALHRGVQESSLADAQRYVRNLRQEWVSQHQPAGRFGAGGSGMAPTTTVPPLVTTTTTTTTTPATAGATSQTAAGSQGGQVAVPPRRTGAAVVRP